MEEIKKALEALKNELEEAQEVYLSKLEAFIASVKNTLETVPKPSSLPFDIEKIYNTISNLVKTQVKVEPPKLPDAILNLKNSLIEIDKGKTQVEILDFYLKESSKYASRVALFIFKNEQAVGWKGVGFTKFGSDDLKIKTTIFPLSEGNPFFNTFQNKSSYFYQPLSEDIICKTLGGPKPEKIILIPLIIKDKVSAALYADEISGAIQLNPNILEILTYSASLCISLIGQRQVLPCPTLSRADKLKFETPRPSKPEVVPPPPPPPPPSPEKTQKFDFRTIEQLEAIKKETLKKPVEIPKEPAPTVEISPPYKPYVPPKIEVPPPEIEEKIPEEIKKEKAEAPEIEYEEIKEEYEVPEAPPPTEWAAVEKEGGFKEFEPVPEPKKATIPPKPAPPPPPPVENIEEIYLKKGVEVKPPPDFRKERPGFGFETIPAQPGLTPEESRKHDEARRFARLLVSEIKLYNENKVEEGRRNKNIYALLKEDIDRSRQLYEERIPAEVRAKSDYFRQALISILAGGDASALGPMDF